MGFSGGDPQVLHGAANGLGDLSSDLAADATQLAVQGKAAAAHAGDGCVADLAESALAAIGGVVIATSTIVQGLSAGSTTAGSQLSSATGAMPR